MGTYSRPNGGTFFATLPGLDPDIGAYLDSEFNGQAATVNALDNANIASTPKIAGSKVDLTTSGFLPLTGGSLSALLTHNFDGIFRLMRASGNGRIREYRGSDGALWGISYNTEWVSGAWAGRDITDVCAALKMESDGLHYYHAVSGAAASVPSFTEVFHVDTSGVFQVTDCVQTSNIQDGAITKEKLVTQAVGDYIILNNSDVRTATSATYVKIKETKIGAAGTYRIKFSLYTGGGGFEVKGQIYKNGSAFGTERATASASPVVYSEDLTFAVGDLIQIYVKYSSNAETAYVADFKVCVGTPLIAGVLNGY